MSGGTLPKRGEELMPKMNFLDDDELLSLSTYKYHGIDLSIVTKYAFDPFWNFLVDHVVPRNVSANMLTVMGLICNIISITWVLVATDFGEHDAPNWIYIIIALLNMTYQHLDGIDGKQARKTGTASPLGQLFDHGVDAICSAFHPMIVMFAMGAFHSLLGLIVTYCVIIGFAVYTYEEYITRVLRLDRFSAPVEGLIISQLIMILVGIFGNGFFKTTLFTLSFRFPLSIEKFENGVQPISFRDVFLMGIFISSIYMILDTGVHVYKSLNERLREEDELKFLATQSAEGTVAEETDTNGIPEHARNNLIKYCQEKYKDTPIIFKKIGYERYSAPEAIVPDGSPIVYMLKHYSVVMAPYVVIITACYMGSKYVWLTSIMLLNFTCAYLTLRVILGRLCNMKEDEMVLPFYKKNGKLYRNVIFEFIFPVLIFIALFVPSMAGTAYSVACLVSFMVLCVFIVYTVKQVSSFLGVPIFRIKRRD